HEFMLLAASGEDTLIACTQCGYAANQEVAEFAKGMMAEVEAREEREEREESALDASSTSDEQVRELLTPGATTIAALCYVVGCGPEKTLKGYAMQQAQIWCWG